MASTASAFKFCASVLPALGVTELKAGTEILSQLSERTGQPAPAPLALLSGKAVRFTVSTDKERMEQAVMELL